MCTLNLQNAPRLERNQSRVGIENIARLTGRNNWPVKRETPEEWRAIKSKTRRCRVFLAKERFTKSGNTKKKQLGFVRDAQGNLDFVWKKNSLHCAIPSLTLVSNTESGM